MRVTPAVAALMLTCTLAYLAQLSGFGDTLLVWFGLWPLGIGAQFPPGVPAFHFWQLISYGFLHASLLHLALNMYALWLFGTPLERRWGAAHFTMFFLSCVIGAALMHLIVAEFQLSHGGMPYPVIGASGGVFGLLLGFAMLYPETRLMLLIAPVPIRAPWFVAIYGTIELVAGVTGAASGIAHFAHLGGLLTGYLLLRNASWLD